jgi:hypothetical protein
MIFRLMAIAYSIINTLRYLEDYMQISIIIPTHLFNEGK